MRLDQLQRVTFVTFVCVVRMLFQMSLLLLDCMMYIRNLCISSYIYIYNMYI